MRIAFSDKALQSYKLLPPQIKKAVDKQFRFLLKDLKYPSLHAKKYSEEKDVWQARVTQDYRFYFTIEKDVYFIVAIIKHPK